MPDRRFSKILLPQKGGNGEQDRIQFAIADSVYDSQ